MTDTTSQSPTGEVTSETTVEKVISVHHLQEGEEQFLKNDTGWLEHTLSTGNIRFIIVLISISNFNHGFFCLQLIPDPNPIPAIEHIEQSIDIVVDKREEVSAANAEYFLRTMVPKFTQAVLRRRYVL